MHRLLRLVALLLILLPLNAAGEDHAVAPSPESTLDVVDLTPPGSILVGLDAGQLSLYERGTDGQRTTYHRLRRAPAPPAVPPLTRDPEPSSVRPPSSLLQAGLAAWATTTPPPSSQL